MEHSENIPIFNIPGTLFWEYSPPFHRELFPNITGIYHGNITRKFHAHIFARWKFFFQIQCSFFRVFNIHCMKGIQIWGFCWSVFFCIRTEYGDLPRKSPYSVRKQGNTNQKKLSIWTLLTQ